MRPFLRLLLPAAILLPAISCRIGPFHEIRGNGHVVSDNRTVGDFHDVEGDGFMDVYLTSGNACAVSLQGEENLLPYIRTRVENGKLIVSTKDAISLFSTRGLKVYVTAPLFNNITLSGSGNIISQNDLSNTDHMNFELNGSGDIKVSVHSPNVESDLHGSGEMDLQGETQELKVSIAGSGDFVSGDLKSEDADVSIMGSGSAHLFASKTLTVNVGGSGDIYYKGDPTVSSHVFGSGRLVKE